MVNKSKGIGTAAESAVVRYLLGNGFDTGDAMTRAQRIILHGAQDHGDVAVCPGVMCEVKGGHAAENASDALIAAWLDETETERRNRGADVAFLVLKRKGKGAASAGQWWAHMDGSTFYALGMLAGYRRGVVVPDLPAVRLTLSDAVTLLRRAGYGNPPDGA